MTEITWKNEKRKLSDLKEWELNPRQIKTEEARRLIDSIDQFGQIQPIAIDEENTIIDGHQRRRVWGIAEEYGRDYEVDVRVSSRLLTDEERKRLVILLHKGTIGEWDDDMLANHFDEEMLLDLGFKEFDLFLSTDETPNPSPPEPEIESESLVEIRCSTAALQDMTEILNQWSEWEDVTIDVS